MLEIIFYQNPILFYTSISVLALLSGSFLNVVIYRLPRMIKKEWHEHCETLLGRPVASSKPFNLCTPRSFCPYCKTKIPIWHNIPLFSYCLLLGKCCSCKQNISPRYFQVEALCLVLSLFACWYFGPNLITLFSIIFIECLIAIFFIDLEHQIIPDSLSLSLLWVGLFCNIENGFVPLSEAVLAAAGGYLFLWTMIKLYAALTGKTGMGHGDFKLFAALGAWFGWILLPLILLLASFSGAVIGIAYLKFTKQSKETPIPFGPFLCFSGIVCLFFGQKFIAWYLL